jgi:hypothetical protein
MPIALFKKGLIAQVYFAIQQLIEKIPAIYLQPNIILYLNKILSGYEA